MPHRTPSTAILSVVLALTPSLAAIESWADAKLPHQDRLELWLDGSRLEVSAATAPVAEWRDGSGQGRHLLQGRVVSRPVARSGRSALRFDGLDDFLDGSGPGPAVEELTLFVVAAARSSPGFFRALLSASAVGRNDYTHGINVDLGGAPSERFDFINIEGQGAPGQQNLLLEPIALGKFQLFTITSRAGKGGISLAVDGQPAASRDRAAGRMQLERLFVGARYYSNTPSPPAPSGFFDGEIAEVLAYSRVLPEAEQSAVEGYLRDKHAGLLAEAGLPAPPPQPSLRFLVPGFRVDELPVTLTNVNDLAYLPDGRLVALGYDGRIHVLRDTDKDGLEDTVEPYWTGAPFEQTMAMALSPRGLFVASRGKISLLQDVDGDGRLDKETVAASGWVMPKVATGGGVDAMGLAVDAQGFVYFGLGCDDFTNPYLLKDGKAHFQRGSDRGTIQKLWPDFSRREAVCDGIRFPYGLAFNAAGDLFATDQEGETWCPRGNPLDELNHIQPGRYYGFPPEHAEHLPGVVSEPPVAEFGPQHQSACGLLFNEAAPGGKTFGPPEWAGDAFVGGYSRGKLWRVAMARTAQGYVSQPSLVASARLLLLDLALAADGAIVIACHSGAPDWGTGPGGQGKLFKARFTGSPRARAVSAWAHGPLETRVAFDRPLGRDEAAAIGAGARIVYGAQVRAGDRFEHHRPGYATVAAQVAQSTSDLRVTGSRLSEDGRTLVLATDPHPIDGVYSLTLTAPGEAPNDIALENDLAYTLNGVDVQLSSVGTTPLAWAGWLPHSDLEAARHFTRGSMDHDRLWELLKDPRELRIKPRTPRPHAAPAAPAPRVFPEISGGDWHRGETLFFGQEAKCSACHTLRGKGGRVGPDLSNLVHRDAASVLQDIEKPSAAIHPDHTGYTVVLADGRALSGLVQSDGADALRIFDSNAQETRVERQAVGSIEPMAVSVMPEGLAKTLGPARLKDLLVYLLFASPDDGAKIPGAMHVVLVAGPKDHGPGEHDYPVWQNRWLELLSTIPGVRPEGAWQWPSPAQWRRADLAVFYYWNNDWSDDQLRELDQHLARGGGAVAIHSAVIPPRDPEKLAVRLGLSWVPGRTKFRHGPIAMRAGQSVKSDEPILAGMKNLALTDEIYWPLLGDTSRLQVLLEAEEEGQWHPMAWTFTPEGSKGRVFATLLGHYSATFDEPQARGLFLRGMAWAGGFPVDWDRPPERKHRHAVDRERTDEGDALAKGTLITEGSDRVFTSPWITNEFPFNDVLVSWNVDVPPQEGFAVELRFARQHPDAPTAWYHFGRFGSHPRIEKPHTTDDGGTVEVDCFSAKGLHQAYQYRFRARAAAEGAEPKIRRMTVIVSNQPGNAELHTRFASPIAAASPDPVELKVPFRSQRVEDPAIQGRICSPTSVAMVLAHRGIDQPTSEVARRAFDADHDIYGNWPANIQAAYSFGAPGRIARFRSWEQARAVLAAGQPIIASIRDKQGVLRGAPYATTAGHLLVITGFDAAGDVRVNDPAAGDAQKGVAVYDREAMAKVWLDQGGVAYLIGQ